MRKVLTNLSCLAFVLIYGFGCAWTIVRIINGKPPPLICKVYTWDHPDGKQVRCFKVGTDVQGSYQDEPTQTPTEIIPEPPTPTSFNPWVTPTRTPDPYPSIITQEPYP